MKQSTIITGHPEGSRSIALWLWRVQERKSLEILSRKDCNSQHVTTKPTEEMGTQKEWKAPTSYVDYSLAESGDGRTSRMAAEKISAGKTQACSSLSGLLNLVLCAHAFERAGMWLLVLSHLGNLQSFSLVGFKHKRSWQRMQRK